MSVREQLGQKIKQEVTIGFFPSATTEAGAYNFLRSFMPLSNHLSQGSGVLTSLIPERDVKVYASRIMEQRYPVIFVNAALADTALDAGYAPLVVGEEILTPGFLVQESSKYKKIEDIKGAKIAYTRNAQTSFLAFADLAQQGIAQSANQSTDVGAAGRKGALDLLNSGAADVAILRSAEAQKIAQESNGKLRFIGSSVSAPSTGVWVRKDVVGTGLASALQASLLTVSPDATGSAKLASDGFSAGFGVRGKFVAADDETKAMFASLFGKAKTSYPDLFAKPEFDAAQIQANLARPAIEAIKNSSNDDPLSIRKQLGQKIKQEVTIGFFPSATTEAGAYNFLRSFMPLSNHLSQGSGVLTSLIPERDVKVYASRIMEQRYPVIFVNAALADTALDAGYAPLVVGEEILTPGFLVQESSKYKKIEDIKGAKIAYTRNAQTSFLAFADLAQQGIAQSANQSTDVGAAGRKGALDLLNSGAADVAILRSAEAQKIAQESNGKLRFIGSSVSAPSTGVWVRKDVVGTGLASALQASLLTVSPDATGSAKLASDGFSAGFGVRGKFVAADDETKAMFASLFGKAKTSYPDLFAKPEFDAKKASENLNRVAIQPLGNTK